MMTDEQVLATYALLKQLSERMLASTEEGDWAQWAQQQKEASILMQRLQAGEGQEFRPAAVVAAKQALIVEALAAQKTAMEITLPWRASVAAMLYSAGSAKRVAQAYRQG